MAKQKLSKKQKKKRIATYLADGKISGKEARKAQRRGISLAKIQKSYTPAPVVTGGRGPSQLGATVVTPPPLVISPSAQKTFAGPTTTTSTNTGVTNVTDTGTTDPQGPLVEQPPEPQGPTMEDMFAETIAQMQAAYEQNLAQQQQQVAAMEQQQRQQMAVMQQQMREQQRAASAQAQLAGRPSVLGVQTAQSSAGSPMQISRRGLSGAFGRKGMRIQSLNV